MERVASVSSGGSAGWAYRSAATAETLALVSQSFGHAVPKMRRWFARHCDSTPAGGGGGAAAAAAGEDAAADAVAAVAADESLAAAATLSAAGCCSLLMEQRGYEQEAAVDLTERLFRAGLGLVGPVHKDPSRCVRIP